jgi:hypothetical protein
MTDIDWWIRFLGWSAALNYILLTVIFLVFLGMREWMHRVHGRWFGLTPNQIDIAMYAFMALYKLAVWFFLLMPLIVLLVMR